MNRAQFLGVASSVMAMGSLSVLQKLSNSLDDDGGLTPVLFIGHGSPMNGIENTIYSQYWKKLGETLDRPKAVLCISAHWLTRGTFVTAMENPRTIHDFGGFPQELFDVQYPAPGDPSLAAEIKKEIHSINVGLDHEWGLDHGTWSVVKNMYPNADIPVLQLSIDYHQPAEYHFELAKELMALRKKGVLIIGSGNVVHNLRMVDFTQLEANTGFDWAIDVNNRIKDKILNSDFKSVVDYKNLHEEILKAVPTPDHFYPLIYALGVANSSKNIEVFNDYATGGSLTMTSFIFA